MVTNCGMEYVPMARKYDTCGLELQEGRVYHVHGPSHRGYYRVIKYLYGTVYLESCEGTPWDSGNCVLITGEYFYHTRFTPEGAPIVGFRQEHNATFNNSCGVEQETKIKDINMEINNTVPVPPKVGEAYLVTRCRSDGSSKYKDGQVRIITKVNNAFFYHTNEYGQDSDYNPWANYSFSSYNINKKNMLQPLTDLSNLIQRSFSANTKSLYQAGYLDKSLNITPKLTTFVSEAFVAAIMDGSIATKTLNDFAVDLLAKANAEVAEANAKNA